MYVGVHEDGEHRATTHLAFAVDLALTAVIHIELNGVRRHTKTCDFGHF